MANAVNVTKYLAGGSGDYVIPDGYIKSVEKIWYDTYAMGTATAIPSNTTIDIASIPPNKKIMGVDLYFPALSTGASGTGTTISIGIPGATTTFLNAGEAAVGVLSLSANAGIGTVTAAGTNTTIRLTFGRIATTTTNSTITSIVRYT